MTLIEKVQELQAISPPLKPEEIKAKVDEWKATQPVKPIEEGKTSDSSQANPSEESSSEVTDSNSEDGSSEQLEQQVLTDAEQKANIDPKYTTVAAPGQTYVRDGDPTEYKYDANGQYYFRQKGSEDWQQHDASNERNKGKILAIAEMFGHTDYSQDTANKTRSIYRAGDKLGENVEELLNASMNNKEVSLTEEEQAVLTEVNDATVLSSDFITKTSLDAINFVNNQRQVDNYKKVPSGFSKNDNITYSRVIDKDEPKKNNPEWDKAFNDSKARWNRLKNKPDDISEDEWIKRNMVEVIVQEKEDKKRTAQLTAWVDDQDSDTNWDLLAKKISGIVGPVKFGVGVNQVFDKSSAQKLASLASKKVKLNLKAEQENTEQWFKNADGVINSINASLTAISKADYQTEYEVKRAKAVSAKLLAKKKEIIDIANSKRGELNDILEADNFNNDRISHLEKNFNLIPVVSAGLQSGAVQFGDAAIGLVNEVLQMPEELGLNEDNLLGKAFTALSPGLSILSRVAQSQPYNQTKDQIRSQLKDYSEQIMNGVYVEPFGEINSGSGWGRYGANMLGSQAINTAIMFGTGGAALPILTAQSMGGKANELRDQEKQSLNNLIEWGKNKPIKQEDESDEDFKQRVEQYALDKPTVSNFTPFQRYTTVIGAGLLEFGTERFSLGIINRSFKIAKNVGVDNYRRGFLDQIRSVGTKQGFSNTAKMGGRYIADGLSEGGGEGLVEYGNNWFKRYVLEDKDVNLMDGVVESSVNGLAMSNLVYKLPGIGGQLIGLVQGPVGKDKIRNNVAKITKLQNSLLSNPDMSDLNRGKIEDQIVDLTMKSSNEIDKTLNRFTDIPKKSLKKLGDIELEGFKVDASISEIKKDDNFTVGKDEAIAELENQKIQLAIDKGKILEPFIEADSSVDTDQFVELRTRIQEGSSVIADQLGGGIQRFDNTEDLIGGLTSLEAQGVKVDVKRNEQGQILDAKDQDYGLIAQVPDGEGGFVTQILINNASSQADGVMPADKHETLHFAAANMDPAKKVQMGKDVYNVLKNDSSLEVNESVLKLINQYKAELDSGKLSESDFFEEVMAVTSDGLTDGTIKPKAITGAQLMSSDIVDLGKKIMSTIEWNQEFDKGQGVISFLKDFNADVIKGEGLSQSVKETLEVDMGLETEVDLGTVKSSKASQAKNQKLVREAKRGDLKAVDALIKDNSGIILQKLGFNKDIGDVTSQDILNVVKDQAIGKGLFKGRQKPLFDNYNPTKGEVSTYLGDIVGKRKAEIFKAAGLDATKFDTVSTDAPQAQQVADTTEQAEFDEVTNEEKGRKKVYPSNMPSISKNIKPESIASINEGAKRDILLNASKGVDAIVSSIKSEGKSTAKIIGKDVGTFAKGWPKFVNELVNDGLTKVIPAAALKRRFGNVLNIKKTGTTPTKRVNPTTGKVTTFNKPVYEIPKADNQSLIDYFTGQEKRRTSLLEVLGQDLVVEQLQELKNDNDFMSKLDSLTDGKASEIMDSLDSKLDTRNLEDTSLDTVKASKKKIKPEVAKQQLDDISKAKNAKLVNKVVGQTDLVINNSNRVEMQQGFQSAIETNGITLESFDAGNLQNSGAERVRLKNGDVVYNLSNGKTIPGVLKGKDKNGKKLFDAPTVESIIKVEGEGVTLVAARNRLYYGKSDPAYIKAREAAAKNPNIKKAKRVTAKQAGTTEGNNQAVINQDALERVALELESAVANGMPMEFATMIIQGSYQATTGLIKISAPIVAKSIDPQFAKEGKPNQTSGKEAFREEHSPPASVIGGSLIWAIKNGQVKSVMEGVRNNYVQVLLSKADDVKIDRAGLDSTLPDGVNIMTPNAGILRFAASGINLNTIVDFKTGKSFAETMNVSVAKSSKKNPNIVKAQNSLINEQQTKDIDAKTAQARIKAYEPVAALELESGKINVDNLGDKINVEMTIADQLTMLATYDKAARNARAIDAPKKGISVFDFDDTLAKTKEKVIVNNADGSSTEISAAKFAETANELEANGATFDFSNFEGVADGTKKGPLADLALKRQDKFGSKDIFVLTARPQASAQAIKTFLDGIGLNLPISNITGLANGSPGAKGNWVAGKAAEGYNDFYFADDAYKNVEAVQEVLSQVDVDSKVQIAKASKKKVFNQVFNDIIENSTGIKSYKKYSPAKAQTIGASKGKFDFLIPASAEDFTGLLYKTLGKGKVGDAQMAFYKTNLLDPYNRAEIAVVNAKIQAANDFKALKNNLKTLPKSLSKLTGIGKFTFSQASRVAVWTRQGMTVPGLSKTDLKQLNDFVDNNAELNTFVDELIKIQKGKPYPKPTKNWVSGTITSDITTEINKVNRKEYMQEFQENADIIFNDANMAKLEAAYGPKYVEALKDNLRRMKSGSNRPIGGSRVVNEVLDWLNNSVGAVMFLNTRSAILQTISAVNFIQVSGPNNLLAAGKAFANQKQYWKDFMTLMNSPYLVERRNGLKINVSESEIADAVAESKNKPKAALAYLLSKGFVMTRFADSFAIASGGSTFYRNTVDALVKSGMDQKSAEKKAFDDFRALAEESQQSSNPSRISQQQASAAGRVILAFANTPMQYARIIKKSSQDLINGRGDWKSNVAKIAYYGAMQNVVFNALQQALFALAFSDDEEEKEKQKKDKTGRIVNGMVDSLIKGAGIQGQAVIALKNAIIKIAEEADKKSPEFQKAVDDLLGFSPPLSAKIRKIKGGLKAFSWNRKEMKEKGFDLNNPAYLASAQVISGLTNIPVDRAIKKLNNIRAIFSDSSAKWQKIAMALGWSTWDVGLPFYGVEDKEVQTPQTILRDKVLKMKKETSGPQQKQMLLDLGLTKKEIKALKYEENRVKKIIELQNKNKK